MQLRANVPLGGEVEARPRRELSGYYAHIAATDRAIGRLLEGINLENTVVVFTSVHGDMHGSHGCFRKGWPHEESVRVPMLVRNYAEPPRNDESPVSLQDLHAMTQAWAVGMAWKCDREYGSISMPSVVDFPLQCDRMWRGIRNRNASSLSMPMDQPGNIMIWRTIQMNCVTSPTFLNTRQRLKI